MAAAVDYCGPQSELHSPGHEQTVLLEQSLEPEELPLFQFPAHLQSKLCWTSESFPQASEYVVQFTADDALCVEAAISSFKCWLNNLVSLRRPRTELFHSQEHRVALDQS
jgi:hypothetical protein